MRSIGLLFAAVIISTGDISTAVDLTQTICNAVLPSGGKEQFAPVRLGRLAPPPSGWLVAADRHRPCFLLVNPGMDVRRCLGEVGQIAILE